MLIRSVPGSSGVDVPSLSRKRNFAALRSFLARDEHPLASQTLFLGSEYVAIRPQPEFGNGLTEFVTFSEDFIAVVSDIQLRVDLALGYSGENWLRFNFVVGGEYSLRFDAGADRTIAAGFAHLLLHPEGVTHTDRYRACTQTRWVSILCRKEHLMQTLGFDPAAFPSELQRFFLSGEPSLYLDQRPLNGAMHRCVTDMFRRHTVLALRPLYLRAKAYEALHAYLDDFLIDSEPPHRIGGLSRRHIDKLQEARHIIDRDLTGPVALESLARRLGMSRSKLSHGFHQLFGTTLLDYSRSQRLTAAYELLRGSDLSVTQVAERVGYAHVSTFSSTFKQHFKSSPRELRAAHEPLRGTRRSGNIGGLGTGSRTKTDS